VGLWGLCSYGQIWSLVVSCSLLPIKCAVLSVKCPELEVKVRFVMGHVVHIL
jgi:hypothetical protein